MVLNFHDLLISPSTRDKMFLHMTGTTKVIWAAGSYPVDAKQHFMFSCCGQFQHFIVFLKFPRATKILILRTRYHKTNIASVSFFMHCKLQRPFLILN
ncbi:hypothetical protein Peur_014065 [Populus x canadensis]